MGVTEAAVGIVGPFGLALGQGTTVEVKLELGGGPVEPNYHPSLPVPEAGGGYGLEPVAEGVGIVSMARRVWRTRRTRRVWRMWRTWNVEDMENMEVVEDKKEVTLIIL